MAAELPTEVGAPSGGAIKRLAAQLLVDPTGDGAGEGFDSAVALLLGDGVEGVDSCAGAGDLVMGATAAAAVGVGFGAGLLAGAGAELGTETECRSLLVEDEPTAEPPVYSNGRLSRTD
jgi:hypothetical protein